MSVRWLLWSLLSPSQLLLLSVIVGGLLLALARGTNGWTFRAGRVLSIAGGLGLLLVGLLPTSHYLAHALETRFPQPVLPGRVAGIVLLSGSERPAATEAYGPPQFDSASERYTVALELAHRHPEARLVFTGGLPRDPSTGKLTQTGVAQRFLPAVGLDPARITYEQASTDTCTNASKTRDLVQPRPGEAWVVVTSAMHMPRTMGCFRAIGWEVIPQPADYQVVLGGWNAGTFQVADNLALLDTALHEWVGLVYYRLTGRIPELWPGPFDPSEAAP